MDERKAVTVRIPEAEYKFLRIVAAQEGVSMGAFLGGVVIKELEKQRLQNPDPHGQAAREFVERNST